MLGAKLDFWWWLEETETGKENNSWWDLTELIGHAKESKQEFKESSAF